jgi:hypothetical protein
MEKKIRFPGIKSKITWWFLILLIIPLSWYGLYFWFNNQNFVLNIVFTILCLFGYIALLYLATLKLQNEKTKRRRYIEKHRHEKIWIGAYIFLFMINLFFVYRTSNFIYNSWWNGGKQVCVDKVERLAALQEEYKKAVEIEINNQVGITQALHYAFINTKGKDIDKVKMNVILNRLGYDPTKYKGDLYLKTPTSLNDTSLINKNFQKELMSFRKSVYDLYTSGFKDNENLRADALNSFGSILPGMKAKYYYNNIENYNDDLLQTINSKIESTPKLLKEKYSEANHLDINEIVKNTNSRFNLSNASNPFDYSSINCSWFFIFIISAFVLVQHFLLLLFIYLRLERSGRILPKGSNDTQIYELN